MQEDRAEKYCEHCGAILVGQDEISGHECLQVQYERTATAVMQEHAYSFEGATR